jgi:hypothetical protein
MKHVIKGITVSTKVTVEDFKQEIHWNKKCVCCKHTYSHTNKPYSADDMLGNGVQIDLLHRHPRTGELYGNILFICDDCQLLYGMWKTL